MGPTRPSGPQFSFSEYWWHCEGQRVLMPLWRPGSDHVTWGPMRGLEKNYVKRDRASHKQTSRLYERFGLRADSLKIFKRDKFGTLCLSKSFWIRKNEKSHVSCITYVKCHLLPVTCRLTSVTCHLHKPTQSQTLLLLILPLYTVDWFAKTQNPPKM